MTDAVFHQTAFVSGTVARCQRIAAFFRRWLARAAMAEDTLRMADDTHRTLDGLPDNVLRDLGLSRSDIPFVAGALVSADRDRGAVLRRLPRVVIASRRPR